jgi:septum formation inhibitor-activating ATPase MinD
LESGGKTTFSATSVLPGSVREKDYAVMMWATNLDIIMGLENRIVFDLSTSSKGAAVYPRRHPR